MKGVSNKKSTPGNSNIPAYGQSLITMTQLKAVTSYEYEESDYYADEYYETEYDYEGQEFEMSFQLAEIGRYLMSFLFKL